MIFFKKHKIKSVLCCAAVLALIATVTAAAAEVLGDANTDGTVTIKDVTCIQRVLAELNGGAFSVSAADVDRSSSVNITDATLIQRWLAEMDILYPIGEEITEPTQPPTEPTTEPTEPPTEPPTTEPETEPSTEPTTQSPTDDDGWGREIYQP